MLTSLSRLAICFVLLGACSILTGPERRRVIGVIDPESGLVSLRAPDTAAARTPFEVTVTTYGSSTCTRADGAEVSVTGVIAEIVPYDFERVEGTCTADLAPFPRDVALRFDTAGEAVVRVRGRRPSYEPGGDSLATVEALVVVR